MKTRSLDSPKAHQFTPKNKKVLRVVIDDEALEMKHLNLSLNTAMNKKVPVSLSTRCAKSSVPHTDHSFSGSYTSKEIQEKLKRSAEKLAFLTKSAQNRRDKSKTPKNRSLIFKEKAKLVASTDASPVSAKDLWADVFVTKIQSTLWTLEQYLKLTLPKKIRQEHAQAKLKLDTKVKDLIDFLHTTALDKSPHKRLKEKILGLKDSPSEYVLKTLDKQQDFSKHKFIEMQKDLENIIAKEKENKQAFCALQKEHVKLLAYLDERIQRSDSFEQINEDRNRTLVHEVKHIAQQINHSILDLQSSQCLDRIVRTIEEVLL